MFVLNSIFISLLHQVICASISLNLFNNATNIHILGSDHPPPFLGYTPDSPSIAGKYYFGGATIPYNAGDETYLGLLPMDYSRDRINAIFPGWWGNSKSLIQYNYTSNSNDSLLYVQCFCILDYPCSCDINSSPEYFDDLPPTRYVKFQEGKSTFPYYINGTLDGDKHHISWASRHKGTVVAICILTIIPGLIICFVLFVVCFD